MTPAASVPSHEPPSYAGPFCAIVAGGGDPPFTVRDDVVDRQPSRRRGSHLAGWERNPGHVIAMPNEHVENVCALRQELAGAIHETARRIAVGLRRAYGCEGISTRQHNEPAG